MKTISLLLLITCIVFANSEANELLQKSSNKNYFIENKGQWAQEVKYLAKIDGMNAWITDFGIVYDYYIIERGYSQKELSEMPEHEIEKHKMEKSSVKGHVVKSIFNNNNFSQQFIGRNKQENYYNYLLGNDKNKWASSVPLYEKAIVKELYDGIDIKYYFDKGLLRYDFIVKPGADISQIAIVLEGVNNYTINEKGELKLETNLGEITHKDIIAYQKTVSGKTKIIKTLFTQNKTGTIGFITENYDKEKELIIDPLVYSTFIGGSGTDAGAGIVIDNSGNVFVIGWTDSPSYPTTTGAYDGSYNSNADVFVSKLNPDATGLVYSTFIGGNLDEYGTGIAIDGSGNAFITGYTLSSNYPTTIGAYDEVFNSNRDVFVSKLNSAGTGLVYSTFIGGNLDDEGSGITIDNSGNAFVTGYTLSSNYPTTTGAFDETFNSGRDIFVCKLNSTGTGLVYSTFIGGSLDEEGSGITVDNSGNAFVTGYTLSSNYPTTTGAFDEVFNSGRDIFVCKLNSTGAGLVYSTFIGGSVEDEGKGIAIDNSGNAFVTGWTESSNYPTTTGAYDETYNGSRDIFLCMLNTTGTSLDYSTFIGSSVGEATDGIAIDNSGSAFITGLTDSPNYPITSGVYDETHNGGYDVFVTKLFDTALPVELTNFSAQVIGESIALNWQTATEVNNYGFEIEASTSLSQQGTEVWEKIGFVEGHGNSNSPKKYSFIDTDFSTAEQSLSYRLKQIDTDGAFEYSKIIEIKIGLPLKYMLSQNYPNPFNPSTTISYRLPFKSNVKIEIFSILGQRVDLITDGIKNAGVHTTLWNASNLASGIYVMRINAFSINGKANFTKSIKMQLLR